MLCAHAWHAAAGSWVTNEKDVIVDVGRLVIDTHDFAARAADALALINSNQDDLQRAVAASAHVVRDTIDGARRTT